MRDVYQEITNRIIADLEAGEKPWELPWKKSGLGGVTLPTNMATGREYNGINTVVLWMQAMAAGYPGHGWMTYKQAQELGANIRKGEKSSPVLYVGFKEDENNERRAFARWYHVFNAAQIDGLDSAAGPVAPPREGRLERCLAIAEASQVPIQYGANSACYYPASDRIDMPAFSQFKGDDHFARTLYHELSHATGSPKRLNRDLQGRFGDDKYAFEELIAEMSSAFLSARTGIDYSNGSAEYIRTWVRRMKEDSRAVFTAASKAAEASDWLYNRQLELQPEPELEASM